MSNDRFIRLPRRSRRARIEDAIFGGIVAAAYAWTSPVALWVAHLIFGFAVPGWAYAAVWIVACDVAMWGMER